MCLYHEGVRKFDANVLIKDSSKSRDAASGDARAIDRLFSAIYKNYHASFGRRVAGALLTERGAHILRAVRAMETNATIGALARRMQLTPSTVSILASRLERQGFLRRRPQRAGRRRTALRLTPPSVQLLSKIKFLSAAEPLVAAARRLSAVERRALLRGLRKLAAAVGMSTTRHPE